MFIHTTIIDVMLPSSHTFGNLTYVILIIIKLMRFSSCNNNFTQEQQNEKQHFGMQV